jgi:hypothetical protein
LWGDIVAIVSVSSPRVRGGSAAAQDKFEATIRDTSTSPFVILSTAVDDRTGQAKTGCAMAPFLLGGIRRETGVSPDEAIDAALANRFHVFHFTKQDAIGNIPFISSPRVCAAVGNGLSVRMRDRSGDFVIESTGEIIDR